MLNETVLLGFRVCFEYNRANSPIRNKQKTEPPTKAKGDVLSLATGNGHGLPVVKEPGVGVALSEVYVVVYEGKSSLFGERGGA